MSIVLLSRSSGVIWESQHGLSGPISVTDMRTAMRGFLDSNVGLHAQVIMPHSRQCGGLAINCCRVAVVQCLVDFDKLQPHCFRSMRWKRKVYFAATFET